MSQKSLFVHQVRKNYTDFIWEVTLDCNVFESNQELWRSRVNVLVDEFQEKVLRRSFYFWVFTSQIVSDLNMCRWLKM